MLGFGGLAACSSAAFLALEARIENPIMPLRILRLRGLVNASLVGGLLVTGMYSVLPRHALPGARPPLQRAADRRRVPALDPDRRGALAGDHRAARGRFGPLRVLTSGMASAVAGLLLFATVGPDTAFFPTIFFACFAIGLGLGTAFMPLLTIAMDDVPAEDAGLGSGITTLSQQIGGALRLAVLSTIAANHTKALADDHGPTSALIGGYQLAFVAGALAIGTGIVLAFALLSGPRRSPLPLEARPPHELRHRGESSMTPEPPRPARPDSHRS